MQTIKTLKDIDILFIVPHEDVIRSVLFVSLLPQAYLSQSVAMPLMWFISNISEMLLTRLLSLSVYIIGFIFVCNILLTFIITIACTGGGSKLSFMMWYLVVLLIYFELFFFAFFGSYSKAFMVKELNLMFLDLIKEGSSSDAMNTIYRIQNILQCCGASGPEDWTNSAMYIPDSCCDSRTQISKLIVIKCPRLGVWYSTDGCAEKEADHFLPYPSLITNVLWKLALFHLIMLIAAFWYRVMTKMDTMDKMMNKQLMLQFPPLPKPTDFPHEPSPTTYYKTVYNKDHYMELMIKGESAGRWVPHYRFDKMRIAYQRLANLKETLNIP